VLGVRGRSALILSAAALPLLIAGCSSDGSTTTTEPTTNAGPDWLDVNEGQVTPSPVRRYGTAAPTPELTLPTLANPAPAPATSPTCTPPPRGAGGINGLDVSPGRTSAVVTFFNPGGDGIVDYKLTAATQDLKTGAQDEVGWTTVTPVGCGDLSASVTGLTPNTDYVFTVDVRRKPTSTLEGLITKTIARSDVVRTTS
jgi:hypothetical protein